MTTSAFSFVENSGHSLITFESSLSDAKWEEIETVGAAIKEKLAEIARPIIIIDLNQLTFMGSSIVALIVRLWKTSKERDGNMIVVNEDPVVNDVLEVAGLAKVWTIVKSLDEANVMVRQPPYAIKSNRPTFLLAILGWVAAAGSVGFVLARMKQIDAMTPENAQIFALVCAGIAGLVGIFSALRDTTKLWKSLGLILVCVSGCLVAAAIMLKLPV
jgi:anti-anti-sigma factor